MQEELSSLRLPELPPLKDLHFCYLKMFPDSYRMTAGGLLRPSSLRFLNWGTMSHGKCLTARILVFLNHLYEGRYTPTNAYGKRESCNVYGKTYEECEAKLEEMIARKRAEIAAEKARLKEQASA